MQNSFFIKKTNSTNDLLKRMLREQQLPEGFVVHSCFQTAGKGQVGNSWESTDGENLLFSMALYPLRIKVEEQFLISQLVSVAIKNTLDNYADNVSVKWPNDIYWNDKKLGGILIENSLQSGRIKSTVIGIGINVNQQHFMSNAPNPVSLFQITDKEHNVEKLLIEIRDNILNEYKKLNPPLIRAAYGEILYRKTGFYAYKVEEKSFMAKLIAVRSDGRLELENETGECRGFYFKEVQFVI
jgi:BirA family transcriptional regulator, biotin operon repressor / biotin---[acetyl-CoA-carboxylase] ligase